MTMVASDPAEPKKKIVSLQSWLFMALLLQLVVIVYHCSMSDAITGDVAMYLQCGQLVLDGQVPFQDLVDVNPPLIMFLNVFPALFARLTTVPLELSGNIFMGVLAMLITVFTAALLKPLMTGSFKRYLGPVLLSGAVLSALVTYDFGQREHYFALVWLPFFFLRLFRYENGAEDYDDRGPVYITLATLSGFLYGIGICLKPYFLIVPVSCEIYWLIVKRNYGAARLLRLHLMPEILAVGVSMFAYGLYFLLMPKAAQQIFFGEVLPLLLSGYSAFNVSGPFSMVNVYWWPVLVFVVVSLIVAAVCRPPRVLAMPVVVSLIAGFALVELQRKGWTYHGISMLLSALLLFVLALAHKLSARSARLQFFGLTIVSALMVTASNFWMIDVHKRLSALTNWQNQIGAYLQAGDRVLYLDTSDCPWYVYSADRNYLPGSRYLWFFNLPMWEYKRDRAKNAAEIASIDAGVQKVVDNIVADAAQRKPAIVLCRVRNCYAMKKDFDLLAYLKRYGFERVLGYYEEKERINDFVVFKLK
jgi:hypothetical protein